MQHSHPRKIPFDPCGVALRCAGLQPIILVKLAAGKRPWKQSVLACHELWHGESRDDHDDDHLTCHLAKHDWIIHNGWPKTLARSIEWDNTRPIRLAQNTTDKMLTNAIKRYPLPLASLRLSHTSISDISMVSVGSLVTLTELDLSNTQITNQGLAHLTTLTQLKSLELSRTRITQNGLCNLYGMKELTSLYLTKWRFPDVSGLAENLPGCTIKNRLVESDLFFSATAVPIRSIFGMQTARMTTTINHFVRNHLERPAPEEAPSDDSEGCNVHALLGKKPFPLRSLKSADANTSRLARQLQQRHQRHYYRDHPAPHSGRNRPGKK